MKFSQEEKENAHAILSDIARSLIEDKNRIAKAIAYYIRNAIEDFHVEYLSDDQMRQLNPLIRNAIYSFIVDYGDNFKGIGKPSCEKQCSERIMQASIKFLKDSRLPNKAISQFKSIIDKNIGLPLTDLANGAGMLAGYDLIFVPKYWEDCQYLSL